MLASSRKPCDAAMPQAAGEIARPTMRTRTGDNAEATATSRSRRANEIIGPYAGTCGGLSYPAMRPACLHCRAGVHARRKVCVVRKDIGRARRRTPPPPAAAPPLAGEALPPVCPALQGGVTTPAGEGCTGAALAGLRRQCPPPCDTAMQGGREQAARNRQPSARPGALPAEFSLPGPFRILPACPAPCACQTPAHGV